MTIGVLRPSPTRDTLTKAAIALGVPVPPTPAGGEITIGDYTVRLDAGVLSIFHASGEGGEFHVGEFADMVARFVSERL